MTKRSDVENPMRAALGERAVIAGIADERDQDREDAISIIAHILRWLEREEEDADPEEVLDMALHHFVVERAERIRADEAQVGDRIKPPDGRAFYLLTDAEHELGKELGDPDKVKLATGWGSVTLDPDAIVEREKP